MVTQALDAIGSALGGFKAGKEGCRIPKKPLRIEHCNQMTLKRALATLPELASVSSRFWAGQILRHKEKNGCLVYVMGFETSS